MIHNDLGKAGQRTMSFGRYKRSNHQVYFYGIEMISGDKDDQVTAQIVYRTYSSNLVQGTFINSDSLELNHNPIKLSWEPLQYCQQVDYDNKCKQIMPIDKPTYTIHSEKNNDISKVNMGSECGLMMVPKEVKKLTVSTTSVDLSKHMKNGNYTINVGMMLDKNVNNGYYAYRPVTYVHSETSSTGFYLNATAIVMLLLVLITSPIICGIVGYYIYKRRKNSYEPLPSM